MAKKVLKFERPAEFYFKTTQKMIDSGHYIGAVNMIRKALKKEPENEEYRLYYAELLTDMNKYEESNSILFEMLSESKEPNADCFFNLGRNFLGLNDFTRARDSFEKYMEIEPDNEFSEEMDDLFMLLEDDIESEEEFIADAMEKEYYRLAQEGKSALDSGEYEKAAEVLEKIKTDRPEFLFAKNNLALAYFCLNRKKAAIRTSEAVLLIDETNIHANCNMALFLSESGRSDEADAYLKKVMDMQYELNDDIHKIAITLCELKRYEDAMSYLLQMKDYDPYDEKTLFYLAMTLYNTGRYNEAIKYLSDVCTLDPPGYVANYFIGMIKEIVQGEREFTEMGYMYQVPQEEVRRRIRYLNEKLKLDREQLEVIWRHDDTLADTLTWGLISGDAFIKKAMSEILASFNDARAEKILKRFLLCKNQPDEIKNDVFLSLKKMGAKEPYVSYIDGSIVEVRVGAYGFSTEELSKYCEKVYMRISEAIKEHCNGQIRLLKDCACLLELYIQKAEPEYVYGDVATLAAAIHHAALVRTGLLANAGEVAAYYQADQAELTALSAEIIETVDKE